jgi:glycosyltransferase involved in cell wall biosynthesis
VVLRSRYEASEKLLVEALAVGTQVVSTNCPKAPLEVLESGRFGALVTVGDPIELARAMENAVDDPFPTDVRSGSGNALCSEGFGATVRAARRA